MYVIDKIENIKCSTHAEAAKIDIVDGNVQISCCCEKHKKFMESQIEYEMYMLLKNDDEDMTEILPLLKRAV